jgi:hypothetical protein
MTDPLEPLRKMIEKCSEYHRFREHERPMIGGYCTCGLFGQTRGQSHDSWMQHFLAAALPALEEAMALIERERAQWEKDYKSLLADSVIQAERIEAMQKTIDFLDGQIARDDAEPFRTLGRRVEP